MKKSDLKTGMQVELRDGSRCIVLLGTPKGDVLKDLNDTTWLSLDSLNESLVGGGERDFDVMSVFLSAYPYQYVIEMPDDACVWRRDEVEKIDIEEGRIYVVEGAERWHTLRAKKIVDKSCIYYLTLWTNDSIFIEDHWLYIKGYTCRHATPKEAAKLVKKEIKNGYYWNGTELIKIK